MPITIIHNTTNGISNNNINNTNASDSALDTGTL